MANDAKSEKKERVPTPVKRMKQNEKRRLINKSYRSSVRTAIRAFETTLSTKEMAVIAERLNHVYSIMDKGVKHGIYKINTANRTKSRMAARVAALQA